MTDKYILDGHTPVPAPSLLAWGRWFETAMEDRIVAKTDIGGTRVSTVFLGLDHNWRDGPPILFETLVFEGPWDGEMDRCSTWAEAEDMHARMVALIRTPKPTVPDTGAEHG